MRNPTYRAGYRVSALILALVFCLFNVGLPIVIAACPMMGKLSTVPSCCAHKQNDTPAIGGAALTKNCCTTVFAADRNHTEFIGERHADGPCFNAITASCCPITLPASGLAVITLGQYTAPSPPSHDIPIFTSSLLI